MYRLFTAGFLLLFLLSCSTDEDKTENTGTEDKDNGITGFNPSVVKPGYPLKITGNSFPPATVELKVLFPISENNNNKQSSGVKEGVILNRTETEIIVVVPFNAVAGMLQLTFGEEVFTGEIEVAPIPQEKIFYFAQGDFFDTGGYGLYSLSLLSNGLLESKVENLSQEIPFDEIQSIEYHPKNDALYGVSYDRLLVNFENGEWSIRCICPEDCDGDDYCPDIDIITNTNNNKRYLLEHALHPDGKFKFMFKEIDSEGKTLNTSAWFEDPPGTDNIFFSPERNEFMVVRIVEYIQVTTYDPETFEVNIRRNLTPTEDPANDEDSPNYSLGIKSYYSKKLSKLFIANRQSVYEVDLENFTLNPINSDYSKDPLTFDVQRLVYYWPTNELFIENRVANYGRVITAVNLASGETRRIGNHDTYLTRPHSPWETKF